MTQDQELADRLFKAAVKLGAPDPERAAADALESTADVDHEHERVYQMVKRIQEHVYGYRT